MASGDDTSLPLNTLLHLLTIKLSSSNYLLWRNQILPLFSYQKLSAHIDGTLSPPAKTIAIENNPSSPNPAYTKWHDADQRALILLLSSLSEEAMSVVLGLQTAHDVWRALEHAYSHDSIDRMHTLRDSLRQLQKGTSTVADYGRKFKLICDQLAAIGHPVDDDDKNHWFLCGLGSSFEVFSTTQRAIKPRPTFCDLLSQAENHELFLKTVHHSAASPAAFTAQPRRTSSGSFRGSSTFRGRGRSFNRGNRNRGHIPQCQLCRKSGHYATACPDLSSFAQRTPSIDAHLAQAFHAKCHVTDNSPDWYMDSGASAHMTASPSTLDSTTPYSGTEQVTFGNASSHKRDTSSGTS